MILYSYKPCYRPYGIVDGMLLQSLKPLRQPGLKGLPPVTRFDSPRPGDLPKRRLFQEREEIDLAEPLIVAEPSYAALQRLERKEAFVQFVVDKSKAKPAGPKERIPNGQFEGPRLPIVSSLTKDSLPYAQLETQPPAFMQPSGKEKPLPSLPLKPNGRPVSPPRDDVLYRPPVRPRPPTPDDLPPSRFSEYSTAVLGVSDGEDTPVWLKLARNLTLPRNFGSRRNR